jgi:beta-lactam-binding protein with PASTA domain
MLHATNDLNSPPSARLPLRSFKPFTCRRTRSAKRWAVMTMLAMTLTTNGGPLFMPAVNAQTAPVGAGFALNAGDLRFIFHAIQIAQAHAAGGELVGLGPNQVAEVRLPFGLRTVDGSFNHLSTDNRTFGAADQLFPRLTTPVFRPAEVTPPAFGPPVPTSYAQKTGNVFDSQPRVISNLIADQTVRNPAAVAVSTAANGGIPVTPDPLGTLPIGNVAPDVGLSAPFNSMFTFFGQFFDHGLDLVTKGGGTVFVPLKADDPLFNPGPDGIPNTADDPPTNFMTLTRATNQPGPDGILGTNDDIQEGTNTTTPFVDQNQTYTSHPSHQVFLREYVMSAGRPVSTGRMIDGGGTIGAVPVKNIGNWAEVKAQALNLLGIRLVDSDVFNVPLLATDPYGRFLRSAAGFPIMMMADGTTRTGTPAAPITTAGSRKTGHGFLDDIAHNAAPKPGLTPDPDANISVAGSLQPAGTYDNELLDRHFVTGDGRGNENIALTTVHTVFHAEHNRLRDNIDGLIHTLLTPAEIAAWEATDPASGWDYGEHLFQAARFVTEMQYQHLVFEEFARKLAPSINPFIGDGINFVNGINPAITAEFAHQVYRLGHSMLTETIERINFDGSRNDIELLDGFLNPLAFNNGGPAGPLTAAQAAGAVFQGMTAQTGNEIDEFVTEAVRNRLLGLPLDLAVLNLARGRSEGVAPLNSVRRQLYLGTSDGALAPYNNWIDFQFSSKHPESMVNFVAAYGTHPTITGATTLADKRAAADAIVNGVGAAPPADRFDFLFSTGTWASGPNGVTTTGVDGIDLWIGGLAERIAPFGGMLGSTFNFVFENQLENLQNADRFYYLERLDGLNLLSQLEANSFAELISRNVALNGAPADVFSNPGLTFYLAAQNTTGAIIDDPATPYDETSLLIRLPDGTIRYSGAEHVNWVGRDDANGDVIFSSEGDDTLRGNGGNDRMEGGSGNDNHIGGAGDDVLTDLFGDDVMKGGPGHDAINGGAGPFDLLQGNEGNDFVVGGNDLSEVFGGTGNDIIYMGKGLSESIGGAGDDWMEGTESPASIAIGDDNNQFQNDPNGGHDILVAGPGDMDFDAEGGDDIMVGNVLPTHRFEGMLGFDWVTYRGETIPVDADMLITGAIAVNAPLNENRDRFDLLEGLSGTSFNDLLRGDNRLAANLANDGLTGVANGHVLNAAGIARITGLAAILPVGATSWGDGNIILGGEGSDLIEGRGGDDILDGDRWLNVQMSAPNLSTADTTDVLLYDGIFKAPSVCATRACNAIEARTLQAAVFATTNRINPGSIAFVRSIVRPVVPAADCGVAAPLNCDTAVFSGNRAEYTITRVGLVSANTFTVDHNGGIDGRDTVRNFERLAFLDQTVSTTGIAGGVAVPNLTGLTDAQARAAITGAGLTVGAVTTGNSPTVAVNRVMEQNPLAGVGVTAGSAVSFVITLGALVPDIHEQTVTDGRALLTAAGLTPGGTLNVNDPEIPAGLVAGTNPAAGSSVPPGTTVTLLVSVGPATVNTVPSVVNLLQGDGEDAIIAAGLAVGAITFANSNTVAAGAIISTTPVAGTVLTAGSAVAIRVSLGSDGLVLALGFDEATGTRAIDSSPVGNDGTLRQATMVRAAGRFGSAVRFDGVDDWVTVVDGVASSPLDLTTGMTLEAWVNPSVMSGWETVLLKERGTGLLSYALYAHDGAPLAGGRAVPAGYIRAQGVDQPVRGTTALPLNTWTHIATTYDGTTQRFFVNGVQVGSSPMSTAIAVGNQQLRIGGNNAFTGEFFQGLIDEVRVYNRARTAAQITADMNTPVVR